ncbi:MAG: transcriptional repressor [Clostridia bacterium]|nr:transcriptional repressor [Clostridia bacterium]
MAKLQDTILNILQDSQGHMTAEDVFMLAKNQGENISLASTYRVLGQLADKGIIKRVKTNGQKDMFDKNVYDHGHLVCTSCGKVADISIPNLKELIVKNAVVDDIISYNLNIDYLCDECKKQGR